MSWTKPPSAVILTRSIPAGTTKPASSWAIISSHAPVPCQFGGHHLCLPHHRRSQLRDVRGELRQIASRGNFALTEAEYLEIITGKTAALTACCCHLGRIMSGRLRR